MPSVNLRPPPWRPSPHAVISGVCTGLVALPRVPLTQRPDSAVAIWGLTGREGGAEAGWQEHIWRQAAIAAGGWTAFPAHAYACASPEERGAGWPPGGAPYGKCVGFYLFILQDFNQNKRSGEEKKIGKENFEKGSL